MRARVKGVRVVFWGGARCERSERGDSMDSELRSVVEGKSVSAVVLTDERGMSAVRTGAGGFSGAWRDRRCFWTCIATRAWTSVSNFWCSFSISLWIWRSISSRAFTSHSRRTVDSISAFSFSFSASKRETMVSASWARWRACSSLLFSCFPSATTSFSFLINRTIGRFRSVAVSGRCRGLVFKQLLMTFCSSGE